MSPNKQPSKKTKTNKQTNKKPHTYFRDNGNSLIGEVKHKSMRLDQTR